MLRYIYTIIGFCTCILFFQHVNAIPFTVVGGKNKVSIVYAADDKKLDSIAAHLLAADIERVTNYLPVVTTDITTVKGNVILIGTNNSTLIKILKQPSFTTLNNKWETYSLKLLKKPLTNIDNALVIAGSDARGTAYGVFAVSEKTGVSPWYWWADVTPDKKPMLTLDITDFTSAPPSVKFRGIFINDEDWGLQPWAANTFEPETKDIGPKTYAKIFELLLRLKANLIWPAMHPGTKAFYSYPGNKDMAAAYEIVVGSSHAEPMLRNNVGEWNEKEMGHFNYITNKDKVYNYWESRVKESSANNVIYTIGMRGVHDSGIEGVKDPKEAVPLLHRIFADQRGMFEKYINKDATKVPQVLTPYKEVLEIYDNGLKVPDDVTLVWPDDNYGYIQRLSNEKEAQRSGGSGVYYHASYWGRPHDYLWLSTTHPALIREEMTKAYELGARNLWVLNIGDIKPAEYNLSLFLDMAYNIKPFTDPSYSKQHMQNWHAGLFGPTIATAITNTMWQYYQLAFERKPEFMGWSQTEPTTGINFTEYNHNSFGDQAQQRLDQYTALQTAAATIATAIPVNKKDAFFQLVSYSVNGAALMNKKFLYRDKAYLYARQGRVSAAQYAVLSDSAYQQIVQQTAHYNDELANGKWKDMMTMKPRKLPVFDMPVFDLPITKTTESWNVLPEGFIPDTSDLPAAKQPLMLPRFDRWNKQQYFIDVFLTQQIPVDFTVTTSAPWIKTSVQKGSLKADSLNSQKRLWVSVDWAKAPLKNLPGEVTIKSGNRQLSVYVRPVADNDAVKGFVESDGFININAGSYSAISGQGKNQWLPVDGLGTSGKSMETFPLQAGPVANITDTSRIRNNAALTYIFNNFNTTNAAVTIQTIPTAPLNNHFEVRYAVSIDDGPLQIFNFKTAGRSKEWKDNVLRNAAQKTMKIPELKAGRHQLKIYMVDPGVILDKIFISFNQPASHYGSMLQNTPVK